MKTQKPRAPIPHNGKYSTSLFAEQVIAFSWGDQPDLSDEPDLPELEINWDEIPKRSDEPTPILENAISFLVEYWTKLPMPDAEPGLSDEECNLEIDRLLSEQMLLDCLASEKINVSLKRIRSYQIDIELESGHDLSLHSICILVELLEKTKRDLEDVLVASFEISKNCLAVSDMDALSQYSALLSLLPQLYQVREFIALPSTLNTAEIVELAHFLYYGGCFKKGVGVGKIRKDVAQMFGIVTSELTLNTIAHTNEHHRTFLLLIKKLIQNCEIEQDKREKKRSNTKRTKQDRLK